MPPPARRLRLLGVTVAALARHTGRVLGASERDGGPVVPGATAVFSG